MSLQLPDDPNAVRDGCKYFLQRNDIIQYIRTVAPWFIIEEAHLVMGKLLNRILSKEVTRAAMNLAPRAGKSMMASTFLSSQFIGRYPHYKILQACYKKDKAKQFSAETRAIVRDVEAYRHIFPNVMLDKDSKSKEQWKISKLVNADGTPMGGGEYNAVGVTTGVAGTGFNLAIIDDPISEQDAYSAIRKAFVNEHWYGSGLITRQQPEFNAILLMMTRWATDDLQGYILAKQRENRERGDEYEHWETLSIPAILDEQAAELLNEVSEECFILNLEIEEEKAQKEGRATRKVERMYFQEGDSYAPRRWRKKQILAIKSNLSSNMEWQALYMQRPVAEEGNILKSKWWIQWCEEGKTPEESNPPACEEIIQVYDTAFNEEEEERGDYTARTTWGVFWHVDPKDQIEKPCIILLERFNKRIGFPELREEAKRSYNEYQPDWVMIEAKASGKSLIQELTRSGLPIKSIKLKGRQDKTARAHVTSGILEKGAVYYMARDWAKDVILQCSEFPRGKNDDMVDTCVAAWEWLRRLYKITIPSDIDFETAATIRNTPEPPKREGSIYA